MVVSNREPYIHSISGDRIVSNRPVSGLTEALDPVMRASKGTWVAYGSGDADKEVVDAHHRVAVPPENPEYTLRRVWLTEDEVAGFYLGFSNEALWPLCHVVFTPPIYKESDWHSYKKVNQIFAEAVLEEVNGRKAVVLVQDYHFALLSRLIKEQNPALTVGQFWHIPWTTYEIFRTCPWHEEILDGLLGNDLLGFHVQSFCNNFLETVENTLEARIDRNRFAVTYRGKTTLVQPFPISVDFDALSQSAGTEEVEREMESLRREFNLEGKFVGLGTDRVDYTKGIPERLQALDKLLEDSPDYRGKIVFIQAGMPSRTQIESYQNLNRRVDQLTEKINTRYGNDAWQPVIMMARQLTPVTLAALRRLANFCVVNSLHDGMNLVAKEYVSSRVDGDGVLILSRFTGAATEMEDALLINPYDISEFARKIKEALEMPEAERRRRMAGMRDVVAGNNIYRWGASHVSRLISLAGIR
ncbi:MAG: trehalose-6-phosphate synthase [Dehalococcoidales bacterium]|nr:trehalose-6-phosphate synthase [Dehalococcoidales bacterium]